MQASSKVPGRADGRIPAPPGSRKVYRFAVLCWRCPWPITCGLTLKVDGSPPCTHEWAAIARVGGPWGGASQSPRGCCASLVPVKDKPEMSCFRKAGVVETYKSSSETKLKSCSNRPGAYGLLELSLFEEISCTPPLLLTSMLMLTPDPGRRCGFIKSSRLYCLSSSPAQCVYPRPGVGLVCTYSLHEGQTWSREG